MPTYEEALQMSEGPRTPQARMIKWLLGETNRFREELCKLTNERDSLLRAQARIKAILMENEENPDRESIDGDSLMTRPNRELFEDDSIDAFAPPDFSTQKPGDEVLCQELLGQADLIGGESSVRDQGGFFQERTSSDDKGDDTMDSDLTMFSGASEILEGVKEEENCDPETDSPPAVCETKSEDEALITSYDWYPGWTKTDDAPVVLNGRRLTKKQRKNLPGVDCYLCEKYYNACNFGETEKRKVINKCSRHRQLYENPKTPPGFWDIDFPPTQELEKGYKAAAAESYDPNL